MKKLDEKLVKSAEQAAKAIIDIARKYELPVDMNTTNALREATILGFQQAMKLKRGGE